MPYRPLHVVEVCAGIATGMEILLRARHHIATYSWADINPDAHTATLHRLSLLQSRFPTLLSPASILHKESGINASHSTPKLSPQPHSHNSPMASTSL